MKRTAGVLFSSCLLLSIIVGVNAIPLATMPVFNSATTIHDIYQTDTGFLIQSGDRYLFSNYEPGKMLGLETSSIINTNTLYYKQTEDAIITLAEVTCTDYVVLVLMAQGKSMPDYLGVSSIVVLNPDGSYGSIETTMCSINSQSVDTFSQERMFLNGKSNLSAHYASLSNIIEELCKMYSINNGLSNNVKSYVQFNNLLLKVKNIVQCDLSEYNKVVNTAIAIAYHDSSYGVTSRGICDEEYISSYVSGAPIFVDIHGDATCVRLPLPDPYSHVIWFSGFVTVICYGQADYYCQKGNDWPVNESVIRRVSGFGAIMAYEFDDIITWSMSGAAQWEVYTEVGFNSGPPQQIEVTGGTYFFGDPGQRDVDRHWLSAC